MANGNLAIITGATAGIGEATAHLLAEHGYNLILTGRRDDRLQKIAKKLKAKSNEVITVCFDVSKKSEVKRAIQDLEKKLPRVSVLVNNAGLAVGRDLVQTGSLEDFDQMIDTNIKGLLYMTRLVVPAMLKKKRGHIINIGSVAGRWSYKAGTVYCASKFAVRAISEGLRMDLEGTNIRVTNIEPGMVETEFSIVRFKDEEKAKEVYANFKPLSAQDIAECIWWSLNRPAHVNIQEMVVFPTDQASIGQVYRRP